MTSLSLSCIGEGNGNPLQYSCLENPRDGRAGWAAIYGVAQSQTRMKWLSSSSSSIMKYIPTLETQRVMCKFSNLPWSSITPWRRQWHPTPVLLPGKSHGQRSLEGCSPWGRWGSDTTERLHFHFSLSCTGEENGTPLQRSCLENSRDAGAWWAAVYGVSQSQTRLKQLSSSSSKHIEIYILHTHHFYTIQVYGRPLSFRLDKLGKNFLMLISFLTHLSLSIRDSNKKRDPLWV